MAEIKGKKYLERFMKQYSKETQKQAKAVIKKSAAAVKKDAKSNCISKEVRRSLKITSQRKGWKRKVGTKSPLSHLIELGTKPHVIKPKKKWLAFKSASAMTLSGQSLYKSAKTGRLVKSKKKSGNVFAMKVNHPGAKAHPYLKPAYEKEKDNCQRNLAKALMNAAKGAK